MAASVSGVSHVSRQMLARHRQLRQALHDALEHERVPTPQFAARREIPQTVGQLPEVPPESAAQTLRYYAPASTSAKCRSYFFHEPGERVRESLAVLAELRAKDGGAARRRMQIRHRREVDHAQAAWELHRATGVVEAAATTVQGAWRADRAHRKEINGAACTLQASWRGHETRQRRSAGRGEFGQAHSGRAGRRPGKRGTRLTDPIPDDPFRSRNRFG
jgi:hypothetical protein